MSVNSQRAGGKYKISGSAVAEVKNYSPQEKANLSTFILVQNLRHLVPEINGHNIKNMIHAGNLKPNERLILLLKAIESNESQSFEQFNFPTEVQLCAIGSDKVSDADKVTTYMKELASLRLIEGESFALGGRGWARLSFQAYEQLEKYGLSLNLSEQIFVAMWFAHDMQAVRDQAIIPAIQAAGYEAMVIDNKPTNEKIDDEIIAEIRKSKALIADLTCGVVYKENKEESAKIGAPRGGVYYEAGFAQGLGLPVIWTVEEDTAKVENVVHFDIQQYNQIRWKQSELDTFRNKLQNRIESTLGRGHAG